MVGARHSAAGQARHTPDRGRELQGPAWGEHRPARWRCKVEPANSDAASTTVAIESLLYRGRAALERALEIRAARTVGDSPMKKSWRSCGPNRARSRGVACASIGRARLESRSVSRSSWDAQGCLAPAVVAGARQVRAFPTFWPRLFLHVIPDAGIRWRINPRARSANLPVGPLWRSTAIGMRSTTSFRPGQAKLRARMP